MVKQEGQKMNERKQIAELVLGARSLWQMYYVEGIIATKYKSDKFWYMKGEMAELAGFYSGMPFGCPFCEHFANKKNACRGCPLDWPIRHAVDDLPPCEHVLSPYKLWRGAKSVKEARIYADSMIELCEKWLDENGIEYEK
jgi:hypothetical protein